jgi:hypothetical protein
MRAKESLHSVCKQFFSSLFENRQRRLAILGRFLCVFRSEFDDPIQLCNFYLHTFALDPSAFQLERMGMRLTTQGFFIPYAWLTVAEQTFTHDLLETAFETVEWDEYTNELRVAKGFKFGDCVMTPLHRRLLLRDYCAICIAQAQMQINPRIPTYALLACKQLLQKTPGDPNLFLVLWILDSLGGIAHTLPVV